MKFKSEYFELSASVQYFPLSGLRFMETPNKLIKYHQLAPPQNPV